MNESQRTEAEDMLWLCNTTDHERYEGHDYCLVHEVAFPSDEPCPETWARLERIRCACDWQGRA